MSGSEHTLSYGDWRVANTFDVKNLAVDDEVLFLEVNWRLVG